MDTAVGGFICGDPRTGSAPVALCVPQCRLQDEHVAETNSGAVATVVSALLWVRIVSESPQEDCDLSPNIHPRLGRPQDIRLGIGVPPAIQGYVKIGCEKSDTLTLLLIPISKRER